MDNGQVWPVSSSVYRGVHPDMGEPEARDFLRCGDAHGSIRVARLGRLCRDHGDLSLVGSRKYVLSNLESRHAVLPQRLLSSTESISQEVGSGRKQKFSCLQEKRRGRRNYSVNPVFFSRRVTRVSSRVISVKSARSSLVSTNRRRPSTPSIRPESRSSTFFKSALLAVSAKPSAIIRARSSFVTPFRPWTE